MADETKLAPQVVIKEEAPLDKWIGRLLPILAILFVGWLVKSGKIDQDTADKVLPLLMSQNEEGDVTIQEVPIEKTTAVATAAPKPVVVAAKPAAKIFVPPKAASITDEQLQQIIDRLMPILEERLKAKPSKPSPTRGQVIVEPSNSKA